MIEKFLEYGYTIEDYKIIRNEYGVAGFKDDTFFNHFINITNFFEQNGYNKEEVIKMTKALPSIYGYIIENIKQKIDDMINIGYNKEEVIKMTKTLPSIYNLSIENIKQKISDMINLGYTKEEVIKMTKALPSIYGYSIENIKQKIDDMINLGYTKEEVIKMTKAFPSIYSLSIENIKQKIDYYKSINISDFIIINTIKLMQSVNLSYARYEFYKEKNVSIDMSNYAKLFVNQKSFERAYGISKEDLLMKYDYEKYMEDLKNGRAN